MGEVYRAHDEKLERDVALKVLPLGMLADDSARKRFRKEALALAKLNHPNVETIYEFASEEGVDFLAMELIAGSTLAQELDGGPLSGQEVLRLGTRIAQGLSAAHEQGVVHCDLKPRNVMVNANGDAKLLDFGLARFFHTSTNSMSTENLTETRAAGTLPYMSPEQVRGERVDARTDIYAAGAVLYEMSTGQRPFPETQTPRLIYAILHQEPRRPIDVNRRVTPGLENIILKALDKNPERRYQSARELAVDLARLSSSAVPVLYPPQRKHRFRLFAAAATMFVAVLVFAIPGLRHFLIRRKAQPVPHSMGPVPTGERRLAILPFAVDGDPDSLDYVADGVAESLYLRLSQLNGLNVSSPSAVDSVTSASFGRSLDKMAADLGVNSVLSGHVRGAGQLLDILVNLQNVSDSKPFWTQEFSGGKSELLRMESQIYDRLLNVLDLSENQDEEFRLLMRPVVSEEAYDLYLKGRERMSARQAVPAPEEAIHFYEESLKKNQNFDLVYIGLADANLALYQEKKSNLFSVREIDAARRAVQLNDASPAAHYSLASAFSATSQNKEAIAELKKAVALVPNSDEAYRLLGGAYMRIGNHQRAIEAFRKAVQVNPYYWQNQNALGDAYFESGDYSETLEAFQQVSKLEPDADAGYENIAAFYLRNGRYQECIPYYQKALQIEPYWTTYSNLGTAYFFLKQYANAAEMYGKAVELNPNDSEVLVNWADSYRWSGQTSKAQAIYQRAISVGYKELQTKPQSASTMAQIALSYAKIGDAHQADSFIQRARAIGRNNVDYIYDQAEIDAILNRQDSALKNLREAFEKHYPADYASGDDELENLQNNPQFEALIKQYTAKKP